MRLTLFWSSAVTLPTVMVSTASTLTMGTHTSRESPSTWISSRSTAANPAALAPADMNAVTAVGAPS